MVGDKMGIMLAKVKDYPFLGTVLIGTAVGLHRALYYTVGWFPDLAGAMAEFSEAWSIYAAFGGVVAIAAGFAGVVVVFALSSESRPFRRLRLAGGERLAANWVSPVAATLAAAFGAFACAILSVAGHPYWAWWLFEFFVLLAAGAAVRLLWLFASLIKLVRANDLDVDAVENAPVSLDQARDRAARRQLG